MTKLAEGRLLPLLPASINDDPQMRAAAEALAPVLKALSLSIPNLLIYARLGRQPVQSMLPPLARLSSARDGLAAPSQDLVERLAWQFHVDFRDVARTVDELAAMTINAIPWHRIKGTPAGIKRALALFGYSGISIEEDGTGAYWATYQLGLPQIATTQTVRHIVSICNEMAPARCRLWRIYTDVFDRRPIVLSQGPALGDGWLTFYSGAPVPVDPDNPAGDDVLVSFGTRNAFQAEAYAPAVACGSFGATTRYGFLAPYLDRFMVGRSRLSDVYPRNHGFAMGSLFSILWAERATVPRRWRGQWDARSWRDYTGFDRKLPLWRMERRAASRAQLVPGRGEPLSEHNARLGVTFAQVIDNPPRLGAAALSAHDPQRRVLRLHEMSIEGRAAATPAAQPGIPATGGHDLLSASTPAPDARRGQQARHDALAGRATPRPETTPSSAAQNLLPMLCAALTPDGRPPQGLTSWLAPQWGGAWTTPGRTWRTEKLLSVQ